MDSHLLFQVPATVIAVVFFLLILLVNWLGFRVWKTKVKKNPDEVKDGMGTMEGSLLGLMALIMGFTFSLAASKFETRRQVIVEEANDIGTAILRCDLYPDSVRNLFRLDFQKYLAARISYYDAGDNEVKIDAALMKASSHSDRIWRRAASLSQNLDNRVRSAQMIPALNSMIDIVTTRDAARIAKVPPIILWVLLMLTLISGFLAGYNQKGKRKNIIMVVAFAAMTTITVYLIAELDRSRRGIINLDSAEKRIVDLRILFTENK